MNWERIPGWTCPQLLRLYDEVAADFKTGKFVEVGVAYGRSLAYMASKAAPDVALVGVDTFHEFVGGDNLPAKVYERLSGCKSPYVACMKCLQVHAPPLTRYTLHMCTSVVGASLHADESCDFVFLDDRHEYEALRDGIKAWLPKVKPGGIIAGHDINAHFPGVQKAFAELLPASVVRSNDDGWGGVWAWRTFA